jgi:hypothetical protein
VVGEYKQTLDEIFTQIDELRGCWSPKGEPTTCFERGGKDTALRLATVYNDWIGYDDTPAARWLRASSPTRCSSTPNAGSW